jgi:hypothetical protein
MRGLVVVIVLTMIAACVSSSGLTGGKAETSDGGSSEGGSSGGGPNLLTNGDFELGCAGWDVAFGFMSEATEAHGGKGSCKFCMDTNWEAFLEQRVTTSVEAGRTYYIEGWFKPAKTVAELDQEGFVESNIRVTSPGADVDFTNGPTFTGEWQRATAIFKPTLPANELEGALRLQQTGNPADQGNVICVYVDDVVMRRLD